MTKLNTIDICDTQYEMTKAYREGAQAMRKQIPYSCNPYRDGTRSYDGWNDGHINESGAEHFRFGVDVINVKLTGRHFAEDPAVPRDSRGEVINAWYQEQLNACFA